MLTQRMARVLVEDENPVLLIGFRALLGSAPEVEVIVADSGTPRLEAVRRHAPDVIVLGAPVPRLGDIAELAGLRTASRIVLVTSADDPRLLVAAIETGAHSCAVHGHFEPSDLVPIILDTARGGSYLSQPVATALVGWLHRGGAGESPSRPGLTRRETEIMELIAAGLANRVIADRLFISEKTVKNHIHTIYRKLKADGREHAAARWRGLTPRPREGVRGGA